jgi:lysophospholipase L1-like esterase
LITPPPLNEQAWDKYCREEFDDLSPRSNEQSKLYGERVKLVAREMGCSLVDSFSLLGGNGDVSAYEKSLEDGLHLSAKGNQLLYDGLMDVIKRDLPNLAPKVNEDESTGIALEGAQWKELC